MPAAPDKASKAANKAYFLTSLQHPKANKLIRNSSSGPQLDLNVFTVKELKSLAASLQVAIQSTDNKAAIIVKITDAVAGDHWHDCNPNFPFVGA